MGHHDTEQVAGDDGDDLDRGHEGRLDERIARCDPCGAQPVGAGAQRVRQPRQAVDALVDEERPVVRHEVARGDRHQGRREGGGQALDGHVGEEGGE